MSGKLTLMRPMVVFLNSIVSPAIFYRIPVGEKLQKIEAV